MLSAVLAAAGAQEGDPAQRPPPPGGPEASPRTLPSPSGTPSTGSPHDRAAPLHRGALRLPPRDTLLHLQRGNQQFVARRRLAPTKLPMPLLPRPAGAGTRLAVVFACADLPYDPAALLGVTPRDVLVLQGPGPFPCSHDVAALELAATEDRASLAVILVHETCATLRLRDPATPAQRALHDRVEVARSGAAAAKLPLADFHGVLVAEQLLQASARLDELRRKGELAFVAGVVEKTGAIRWVGPFTGGDAVVGSDERPAPQEPQALPARR